MRAGWVSVLAGVAMVWMTASMAEPPASSPRPLPRPLAIDPMPAAAQPVALPAATSGATLRPRPRPDLALAPVLAAAAPAVAVGLRPRPRPASLMPPAAAPAVAAPPLAAAAPVPERRGLFGFLRPAARPETPRVQQAAAPRIDPGAQAVRPQRGAVCGVPDILGETLAPITARVQGCGIANPVRVTSVAGIRLSNPATLNCETALAFRDWLTRAVEPAYGKGRVVEVHIAASYVCRPRNNRKGAKISEHGRGNAIDVSGFTFSNGRQVKVLGGFDASMRKAHRAACGIFGTTLGPGSDGFHEDHLHFDIARHRNGPYCR